MAPPPPTGNTIALSPIWVAIGCLFIILIGAIGGLLAQQFTGPVNPPLNKDFKQLVTNVQQVTVSASSLTEKAVADSQRSVVLLAQETPTGRKIVASGLIITNDGLVVSAGSDSAKATVAIDSEGIVSPLSTVGSDNLYGLRYFNLGSGVFTPLPTTETNLPVAAQLLLVSHSPISGQAVARQFFLREYATTDIAPGILQVGKGTSLEDGAFLTGAPAVTEEGKVAGLLLDPDTGTLLPAIDLQRSLKRVVSKQRELDPFTSLGFTPSYTYIDSGTPTKRHFAMVVSSLKTNAPAATSGVKVGDIISSIGEMAVTSDADIVQALSAVAAPTLTISRQDQALVIPISKTTPLPSTSPKPL